MYNRKKISNDVLHVALILVFLRIGPEILLRSPLRDPSVIGDILIGPAIAYQQYDPHDSSMYSNRYVNLKNAGADVVEDLALFRDRLNYYSRRSRQNVIAYYSDRPDQQQSEQSSNTTSTDGENDNSTTNPNNNCTIDEFSDSSSEQAFGNLFNPANMDLSPEDMDLIEILWKQDIDLGVSREAFNLFDNQDTAEKKKIGTEISGETQEHEVEEKPHTDCDGDDVSFYKEWDGSSYTVDSETGEHIIQDQKVNQESESLEESNLFDIQGIEISPDFLTSEECQDLNVLQESVDESQSLGRSFESSIFSDSASIFDADDEKLEDLVQTPAALLYQDETEPDMGEEMYPSMEEYWQDISNTLPLSVMGIASYQSGLSRSSRVISDVSENETASFPTEAIQHPLGNDIFVEALYQNASLAQRSHDINSFSYMNSSAMEPTSLGCAVATSIATLTNDSEPVPDICNNMNGTYGLDLVSLLHPNATAVPPNESLISEILLEDELQLMPVGVVPDEPVSGSSVAKLFHEQMDLSSDSVNSSTSGNMSSMSDCNCGSRKSVEMAGTEPGKKESQYTSSKYSFGHSSMSASYNHADAAFHNSDFDLNSPSHNRSNYSYYLQHNHSYHLPFMNGNNSPKPVTRDKSENSDIDEEHGRDERRAKALKLPITVDEIINLAIDEFNEKLSKFELTEPQLTLIRDIRRRGKNKVAAQNCRKRKMDQISSLQQDLDLLHIERTRLETQRTELLQQRQNMHKKYSQLCQLVFPNPSNPSFTPDVFPSSQRQENGHASSSNTAISRRELESDLVIQGARTKRKIDKKKIDFP